MTVEAAIDHLRDLETLLILNPKLHDGLPEECEGCDALKICREALGALVGMHD